MRLSVIWRIMQIAESVVGRGGWHPRKAESTNCFIIRAGYKLLFIHWNVLTLIDVQLNRSSFICCKFRIWRDVKYTSFCSNISCHLLSCNFAVLTVFLCGMEGRLFLLRKTCEIIRHFLQLYLNNWADAISSPELLGCRSFLLAIACTIDVILPDIRKRLQNPVNTSLLWRISRGIWADQKRRIILNE